MLLASAHIQMQRAAVHMMNVKQERRPSKGEEEDKCDASHSTHALNMEWRPYAQKETERYNEQLRTRNILFDWWLCVFVLRAMMEVPCTYTNTQSHIYYAKPTSYIRIWTACPLFLFVFLFVFGGSKLLALLFQRILWLFERKYWSFYR